MHIYIYIHRHGAINRDRSNIYSSISIRYDRVTIATYQKHQNSDDPKEIDEIQMYKLSVYHHVKPCREYLCSLSTIESQPWKRLIFHLPNEQIVLCTDDVDLESMLERPNIERIKLLS